MKPGEEPDSTNLDTQMEDCSPDVKAHFIKWALYSGPGPVVGVDRKRKPQASERAHAPTTGMKSDQSL